MKNLYLMRTFSRYSGGCYIVAADSRTEAKNIMLNFASKGYDDLFNHQEDIQEKCFEKIGFSQEKESKIVVNCAYYE